MSAMTGGDQASADGPAAHARRVVAGIVRDRRAQFDLQFAVALTQIAEMGSALSRALGETISRDEAIDALRRECLRELENMR